MVERQAMGTKDDGLPAIFQNAEVVQINTEIVKAMKKLITAKKVYLLNKWSKFAKRHVIYVKMRRWQPLM